MDEQPFAFVGIHAGTDPVDRPYELPKRMRPEAMLLLAAARDSGIDELCLTTPHLVHAARLDWEHGDRWDRILLAQATLEDMDLISGDRTFDELTDRRIW